MVHFVGAMFQPQRELATPSRTRVCLNCASEIKQRVTNAVVAGIATASLLCPLQADAASQLEFSQDVPLVCTHRRPACSLSEIGSEQRPRLPATRL